MVLCIYKIGCGDNFFTFLHILRNKAIDFHFNHNMFSSAVFSNIVNNIAIRIFHLRHSSTR